MTVFKRLLIFILIGLAYLVIKEFLLLYQAVKSIHPYAVYGLAVLVILFLGYFVVTPLLNIFRLPRRFGPTRNPDNIQSMIRERINVFRRNPALQKKAVRLSDVPEDRSGYDQMIVLLHPEVKKLHKKYVTQVFYSTAIAQNGFLDALLILSLSVNMVKDLFILYHGRVSNRVLWIIGRMVFQSMLIGGSEGVEYAVDEIFSKMFSGGMKGIPFASKILGSLADGFVNAALVTRIALITQNYCEMIFIESDRALYPAHKTIISTTRILISDLLDRVSDEIRSMTRDKAASVVMATVNPVGYVMSKALNRFADTSEKLSPEQKEWMRETSTVAYNPFRFAVNGFKRLFGKEKKRRNPGISSIDKIRH
ncbi:DUF697 domain-containing protein [bacterium]|nr:DUF697 domain-containing protein [bacterium]